MSSHTRKIQLHIFKDVLVASGILAPLLPPGGGDTHTDLSGIKLLQNDKHIGAPQSTQYRNFVCFGLEVIVLSFIKTKLTYFDLKKKKVNT